MPVARHGAARYTEQLSNWSLSVRSKCGVSDDVRAGSSYWEQERLPLPAAAAARNTAHRARRVRAGVAPASMTKTAHNTVKKTGAAGVTVAALKTEQGAQRAAYARTNPAGVLRMLLVASPPAAEAQQVPEA